MKILVIGDPHGNLPKGLTNIVKKKKIEVIVCVGDVPYSPPNPWEKERWTKVIIKKATRSYEDIVDKLCSYKLPVLILRGNMFYGKEKGYNFTKITRKIFNKNKNLFYKRTGKLKINNRNFILFDMIFEPSASRTKRKYTKRKIETNKRRERKLNYLLKSVEDPIIISHVPPHKILDKVGDFKSIPKEWRGNQGGSKTLARAIKKHKPSYVFCGHIHESKGKKKVGKTTVINAGCCGDYYIVEI